MKYNIINYDLISVKSPETKNRCVLLDPEFAPVQEGLDQLSVIKRLL